MKKLILVLMSFACTSVAQSVPVIVAKAVLQNQSQPVGSSQSPVVLYTPANGGLFRVTILITGGGTACVLNSCATASGLKGESSSISIDLLKPGDSIGYFEQTAGEPGVNYSLYIVVEQL
jgi:hypothetical protein